MRAHIYKDRKGEFRWRLCAGNGRIMADSGEGYRTKRGALNALHTVFSSMRRANLLVQFEGKFFTLLIS